MLWLLRNFFFLLAIFLLTLALLLLLTLDHRPLITGHVQLEQADIQRAREILDTSASQTQYFKTITLTENDLNVACNYLLNRFAISSAKVTIKPEAMINFLITLTLPNSHFFGRYLNISFNLHKIDAHPTVHALSIGHLNIADEFAGIIIKNIIKHTELNEYFILAAQHINRIDVHKSRISITYRTFFHGSSENRELLANKNYQALLFYQQQINQIITRHDAKQRLSLAEIFQPLFQFASQRSDENNAILENRAVIIATSSYVNKKELGSYLPIKLSSARYYPVFLYQRIDMARHFVGSAALAAAGAATLAHMLGQEKELMDAKKQGGSGFSFIDLAGDRAGLKFGLLATASPQSAQKLQQLMSKIENYRAFMPDVRDLPEELSLQQFQEQYKSIYSPEYQNVLQTIDQRIASLPIYNSIMTTQ